MLTTKALRRESEVNMNSEQRQDLERLTALLADPDADVEELDQLYLRLISGELAVIAREGYQRAGRGAVVIGWFGVDLRRTNRAGVPAYYLSAAQAQAIGAGWPAPEIAAVIHTYDPQREFVACVNRAPNPNFYRLSLLARTA
jgi:hypothetical protein